ncbi:J domain-containing protein [Hufsiella ginkgonis]|uniref:J domain-containing protein n=1 Tax=Hufsiella ginkgonis TaxID=2695274 RepID=UPI0019296F10|nr:J domain-containing protein [Hufsiella ginkgonis]
MIQAFPLCWPGNKPRTLKDNRSRASFGKKSTTRNGYDQKVSLTVASATDRLLKELDAYTRVGCDYRVPPESVIISCNVPPSKKGRPSSGMAEPEDPGVAVYFILDGNNYCLPCDKWNRVADNIGAIAAHINALRGIERWGVGQNHDVYTGYKALPESASASSWRQVLNVSAIDDLFTVRLSYRSLAKKHHPSVGGDAEKFQQIQEAWAQAQRELG